MDSIEFGTLVFLIFGSYVGIQFAIQKSSIAQFDKLEELVDDRVRILYQEIDDLKKQLSQSKTE